MLGGGRDHPRVCGEHRNVELCAPLSSGSSPRMRGTPIKYPIGCVAVGIIPAYAGNTAFSSLARLSNWDHPRVCGEHLTRFTLFQPTPGSSPRMRGTHKLVIGQRNRRGIIPAYAGNTCGIGVGHVCRRDHPRVCGEHLYSMSNVR